MSGQTKKIAIVVGLLVLLAVVAWFQLRPSEEDRQYMANVAAQAAGQAPAASAAPTEAAPTGPAGGAAPAGATPSLAKANVDLDELIAGIEKVAFLYDDERHPRDPMRPLIGASAAMPAGTKPGEQAPPPGQAERAARLMRVTGIVWDARNPLAVVTDRLNNQRNDRVIWPGYVYHPLGIVVDTIEPDRVILRVNQSLIPIELEER